MATEGTPICDGSFLAGADLRTKQYYMVKISGGAIALCDTAGEQIFGILWNAPNTGEVAVVAVLGNAKVKTGGIISAMGRFKTHTDGTAKAADLGTVSGANTVGSNCAGFVKVTSASGDVVSCVLTPMGLVPTTVS